MGTFIPVQRLTLHFQHFTFYNFIVNKARGKSGPLFNFDVHDDVRLLADALREKDESHAGKVVERSWYQRNKHIFPASRWEVCGTPNPTEGWLTDSTRFMTLKRSTGSIPSRNPNSRRISSGDCGWGASVEITLKSLSIFDIVVL